MTLRTELQALAWLQPWAALPPARAAELTRKLKQALTPGHVLSERTPEAVAARMDTPDTLFLLAAPEQLCLVQLVKPRTPDPAWPALTEFADVADFVEGCMRPDHLEENDDDV